MPLGMEVGLGPGDCVRWDPATPEKTAHLFPPNFWPMSIVAKRLDGSRCDLIGTEVNLDAGDVVLDRVTAFGSCLSWPNGWMDEDAT